jgi:hypothetical protein
MEDTMENTQHTFDIAWDCEIQTFLQFLLDHNLKLESFIPSGPGGGNPQITVSGPPHQIEEIKAIF